MEISPPPPSPARRVTIQSPRLDAAASRALLEEAAAAFASGTTVLVIDMGKVGFIDSLGVAALATVKRRAPEGSRIVLAALGSYAQTVARVTHLHEVFDIYASMDAAVRVFPC